MAVKLNIQPGLVPYFGGKHFMVRDIIHEISRVYFTGNIKGVIDVFGGGGNVLINIPPEWDVTRIYNDIDERLSITISVMIDEAQRTKLFSKLDYTVNSRPLLDASVAYFSDDSWKTKDPVEVAYWFIVGLQFSFNANMKNYSMRKYFGHTQPIYSYTEKIKDMWRILRLRYNVECLDFRELIKKYNYPEVFLYLDPPYLKSGKSYKFGFEKQDFTDLKASLDTFKGHWLMNESQVDFPFIKSVFGEPYMTKAYTSFSQKSNTTKTKRLEGYWGNF